MRHVCPVALRTPFAGCFHHIPSNVVQRPDHQLRSIARLALGLGQSCKFRPSQSLRVPSLRLSSPNLRDFSTSSVSLARKRWIKSGDQSGRQEKRLDQETLRTWQDYDPDVGIPLESGELDQKTISSIFGPGVDEANGNHILRLVNYRRISGSLIDIGAVFPPDFGISEQTATKALDYLREQDPNFNEQEAGAAWVEAEINKVEQEYMARAEKLGIYKKTEAETEADAQQSQSDQDRLYGESALAALRRENKARWMEADRKKKELKEQQRVEKLAAQLREKGQKVSPEALKKAQQEASKSEQSTSDDIALQQPVGKAWLQPVERKSWVKYYEEQATIVKENKVPQMSLLRRLGPSTLLALAIIGACIALHEMYAPPPKSARMFPNVPPAIATLGAITAINFAAFLAWRIPFLWRTMNKYFQVAPGYPFAMGVFGAQFGHQTMAHLLINTVLLWPFGLMLHEDVGRGTFLAIYLGCGTLGAYGSLVYNVLQQRWLYYIFGSSTAVLGTLASTCLIRADHDVKILGYQVPMTGMTLLGIFGGLQVLAAWKGTATNVDYPGHLTGMAAGVAAAWYVRRQAAQREMTRKDYVPGESGEGSL